MVSVRKGFDVSDFIYYDLRQRVGRRDIGLLFPGWREGDERVMVLSPHDDDAMLGAGYAMAACRAHGAPVYVGILCDGSAGYSRVEDKDTIVEVRRGESLRAYARVGVPAERVHYFGFPDFSLVSRIGWKLPDGSEGALRPLVALLRELAITRLLIPNGYREHVDHEAAYDIGRYDGVQAGDPVGVDWGAPSAVRSTLQYAVWGDLAPEDALLHGAPPDIRANRALVAPPAVEEEIAVALAEWKSQALIIDDLIEQRRERDCGLGLAEVYIALDPRPRLDYGPYTRLLPTLPVS